MSHQWVLAWPEVAVLDANATASGVNVRDLMEAAGRAVAEEAWSILSSSNDIGDVLVLCGPGNNGGDGFAAASMLAERGVSVIILASHNAQSSSAADEQRTICIENDVQMHIWPERPECSHPLLIIDALVGVGGDGPGTPPRGNIAEILEWITPHSGYSQVLACDIPTVLGHPSSLTAYRTITFHAEKEGMRDAHGIPVPEVGQVTIAPLPWPPSTTDCGPGDVLRLPPLDPLARKGDRGRVLIIGGGPYHGAPLLAGAAAARTGCDLVHVAMPIAASRRASWPPHLIAESIPDENHLTIASTEILTARLSSGRGCQSLLIGPGLGQHPETLEAVKSLLDAASKLNLPVVVDADGIAALPHQQWPTSIEGIITPHEKEALQWLGPSTDVIRPDLDAAAHNEGRAVVVTGSVDHLFGSHGRGCQATGGHPRMSTGGTGDLLSGLCAGLLAQGMKAWPAARLACALLRAAGSEAADVKGLGLLADDVPPYIADVLMRWTMTMEQ
ncbi:MAG: NAD(P)H-hydrate dehydratase [Euryarchaeota archaeon]|nr:NAD(P)H-hydrate dehydratase [Euryarchaeota archaeon]